MRIVKKNPNPRIPAGKGEGDEITIAVPSDMHTHLRWKKMMGRVLRYSTAWAWYLIVMPNVPLLRTATEALAHKARIVRLMRKQKLPPAVPLMTCYLTDKTTKREVQEMARAGIVGLKLYPAHKDGGGVTTGAAHGVTDIRKRYPIFAEMAKLGLVLLWHVQHADPEMYCLDRERAQLTEVERVARAFPNLRIVIEHISTREAIRVVRKYKNVACTVTPHHLVLTTNDVIDKLLHPHNFCMPIAQRPEDRAAIRRFATSGHPRCFAGTDTAPHPIRKKECEEGCAGIWNAPVALAIYVGVFEEEGQLANLEKFLSINGPKFYRLSPPLRTITIVRKPWQVPARIAGLVPLWARKWLDWQLAA